jgi:transposase
MASVHVERLDHLGLIACMIQDVGLISLIDARLVPDEPEESTPGEAVAGMLLKGLGGAHRPRSLTPQCFTNTPLDLLCRPGGRAERFHRFQLGRTLDAVQAYGGELVLSELALAGCAQERLEPRVPHLDPTSFSLTGDDVPASDEHAMRITHGYAKDHRPDVKQAVFALLVSHEGGGPLVSNSGDGHTSDTQIVQERAEALMAALAPSPTPRYLVADAKLSPEDTAATLAQLGCIPRIPGTLKRVAQVIPQALQGDRWARLDARPRYDGRELCHDGMAQRWLGVSSPAAMERAEAHRNKAQQRAWAALEKPLLPLHAKRFETPAAAQAALTARSPAWRYHQRAGGELIDPKR